MNTDLNFPSISIVIVNKNGGKKLEESLRSIRNQDYPNSQIEILIIDGGSTDQSSDVSKKFQAKFISAGFSDNQEARRHVGIKEASNEIIASIDSDNYLPDRNWLSNMVKPFLDDPQIFAVQTLYYAYRSKDGLLNRYFALFGVNDPVAFYLGKADRMPHYAKKWILRGQELDCGGYFKVSFNSEDLPTVGCNGFLVRRSIINPILDFPENYFHTDVVVDILRSGGKYIAFVKNTIIHETSDNFLHIIRKRLFYFKKHSVNLKSRRRYQVFDSGSARDLLHLALFILYTVTLIKPLFDSWRGYIKKPDVAWFVHPIVCIFFLFAYGITVAQKSFAKTEEEVTA